MDCHKVIEILQQEIDGRLSPSESDEIRRHLEGCEPCSAEAKSLEKIGEYLRRWSESNASVESPRLDALWTRVRAEIEEGKNSRPRLSERIVRWLWVPAAAALAVSAMLIYSSKVNKAPFNPNSFEVSVEDIDSDDAMVAFVDRGEDLPKVIWIMENDKT